MTLFLLALLLAGAAYLFYGAQYSESMAGLTALMVIPAALGGLAMQLTDPTGKQPLLGCIIFPTAGICLIAGLSWFVIGEGAVCIAMVLPLWIPAAIAGAAVNQWNARRWRKWERESTFYSAGWLVLPMLLGLFEFANAPQWHERRVDRAIIVQATPDQIWPLLVSIPDIQPGEGRWNPTQDVIGIPRPTGARLVADQGRMVRKAQWGNDVRFEERIDEWQPGKSIGWSFAFPDRSVQLRTDRHISPDGPILKIVSGRYELTEVAPGRTQIRLTTEYRMRTRLQSYLTWWGQRLLGDIQDNVLHIVKDRAEKEANRKP